MILVVTFIVLGLSIVYLVKALTARQFKAEGKYSIPGRFYTLKWIIFYVIYRWKAQKKRRESYDTGADLRYLANKSSSQEEKWVENNGLGFRLKFSDNKMEEVKGVEDSLYAIDATYFNAFEEKSSSVMGDVSLSLGYTRRCRDYAEILFQIYIPGRGMLQHPSHPDRIICDAWTGEDTYNGGGITIEMLDPMRRWRLSYNGLMRVMKTTETRKVVAPDEEELIHVKFSIIWTSYTDVIDFDTDISASCIANSFACEPWSKEFFANIQEMHSNQSHYEQWGQFDGTMQLENEEQRTLLLRGARDRTFSRRDWKQFHRYIIFMFHMDDGTSINVSTICMDKTLTRFTLGYVIHPNRDVDAVTSVHLNLWEYGEDGNIPKEMLFSFEAGKQTYSVFCKIRLIPEYQCGFNWEGKVHETLADFHLNGVSGRGIAEFYYRQPERRGNADIPRSLRRIDSINIIESRTQTDCPFALSFTEDQCTVDKNVGGKGSQLAILTKWMIDKFKVPPGFCVTTQAFQHHLENNKHLKELLDKTVKASRTASEDLEEFCERILQEFTDSTTSPEFDTVVEKEYTKLRPDGQAIVAVRSSAVGEDSVEMSAAGQLDTFLGVRGLDEVIKAIKKCWGCQFSYQAVQYRRQHGQSVLSTMGVVIQVMVENPKTSGVLFTQHPVTGNPGQMMINANYGLGETVVSGSADPDTILISRLPGKDPKIISRSVGSKQEKMLIDESGVLEKLKVSADDSQVVSLTDEEVFRLIAIGKTLEENFGSTRDIEWALDQSGQIHLLQARPITTDFTETEYEIEHEFDSAMPSNFAWITTANISEMMSGATTPLTSSTFMRAVDYAVHDLFSKSRSVGHPLYYQASCLQYHRHGFLNYIQTLAINKHTNIDSDKESFDVSIFGEVKNELDEETAIAYHRSWFPLHHRILNTVRFWKNMIHCYRQYKTFLADVEKQDFHADNPGNSYRIISENLFSIYAENWRLYVVYAALSALANRILLSILSKGKQEWNTTHYSDVAMIYGTSGYVVSGAAPGLLQKIANLIRESKDKDKFLSMESREAIDWLIKSEDTPGNLFRQFLKEFGHRCIKEGEFHALSWAGDPGQLGTSLQESVRTPTIEKPKKTLSTKEAIAQLKTPVSSFSKFLLKFVIPKARKAPEGREWGKSMVIKVSDKFKQAYWKLANQLQNEGYIPDADLMFYLTHGEIGKLLKTRSSRLIIRAIRRRRLQPKLNEIIFPEISKELPPIPVDLNDLSDKNCTQFSVQGCPVSHGSIKGTARVVLSLEGAKDIKEGEVLIVRTTDVGWSPYFPLISGLVTEIGGMMSHGAVVAREYGLPCIVNAKRATQLFKNGDKVLLNGGQGSLRKID